MLKRSSRLPAVQLQNPLVAGIVAPAVECVQVNEVESERRIEVE